MPTKRYLHYKGVCNHAQARLNSGDNDGKYGSLEFYDKDKEELHRVYIREEQFRQIYEDLRGYFMREAREK